MKNNHKIIFAISLMIFAFFATSAKAENAIGATTQKFSPEELVSLSRPSVVRIVQHVKGEIVFKSFSLDLDKLTISAGGGQTLKIPVDEYTTGSGFIVSEDGYILTNSHVISDQEIKRKIISQTAENAILEASFFSMNFGNETTEPEKFEDYAKRIDEYLLREGTFNFEEKVVVLDPSSKGEKTLDLIAEGFPVTIVSVNGNFQQDKKDIALIKIDQKNLPTLPLGNSDSIERGQKIGVFGFPQAAELNDKKMLESTFTQGVVSAIKESENKDFKIIQTDAKISEGSSGSPLLNEQGQVIGMITYQTSKSEGVGGDNFAFAIPINVVKEGIKNFNTSGSNIEFAAGRYNEQFSKGLKLMEELKCKKALVEFQNVKTANEKFNIDANVAPYVKRCQDLILTGQSVDTRWDRAKKMLIGLDDWIWIIISVLLLIIFGTSLKLFTVKKRLKKDEKEIVLLEEELKQNEQGDVEERKEIQKIEAELEQMRKKKN